MAAAKGAAKNKNEPVEAKKRAKKKAAKSLSFLSPGP
jgi:hypothetical protein